MTLDELLARTPDQWKPVVAKYGPALVAMTAQQFADWLDLLINGKTYAAWQAIMAGMSNAELIAAWQDVGADWDKANAANAGRIAMQREAAMTVLKILLAVALAAAGL